MDFEAEKLWKDRSGCCLFKCGNTIYKGLKNKRKKFVSSDSGTRNATIENAGSKAQM